jgi:hypothetical protein
MDRRGRAHARPVRGNSDFSSPQRRRQLDRARRPERYDPRLDEYRLPKEEGARTQLAVEIGLDGHALLDALEADPQMACLLQAPAITTLRRVWLQRYYADSKQTKNTAWR